MYGLVRLHEDTSQWSTQGFGNTLSTLVDAGLETGRDLIGRSPLSLLSTFPSKEWYFEVELIFVVVEERASDYFESEEFLANDRATRKSSRIRQAWHQQVPMLSGSEKRDSLGGDGGYSGRTIDVARILGRWFQFDEGVWVIDEED